MIILFRSRIALNRMFAVAKWTIISIACALCLYYSISLYRLKPLEIVEPKKVTVSSIDEDKMLTGPLGLYENKRSLMALALEQNLLLFVQNVRPDLRQGEKTFHLSMKGSGAQKLIRENEPISFGWDEKNIELTSGDKVMVPHLLNGSSVLFQVGEEELILQAHAQKPASNNVDNFDLDQAKWWGNDLFFREYGGAEYHQLGKKYKIEMSDGANRYFIYAGPNDYLSFKEGRWRVLSSLEMADRSAPLAVVRTLSASELEIEAWDQHGTLVPGARLPLQRGQPIRKAADQIITDPKLRSGKIVACKIGKKRLALRPNDWIIKTQTGWRKLITTNEIESYLNNEQLEELFVVDSIEQNGQMRGRHFDLLRTQMKPFIVQASVSKAKSQKRRSIGIR